MAFGNSIPVNFLSYQITLLKFYALPSFFTCEFQNGTTKSVDGSFRIACLDPDRPCSYFVA